MSKISLLNFFGYERSIIEAMDQRSIASLAFTYTLSLISAIAMACSGAYIPFFRPTLDTPYLLTSITFFLAVLAFVFCMQRLFTTMGGFPLHQDPNDSISWKHNPIRIVLMLLMAIVFSQPIVLLLNEAFSLGGASVEKNINLYVDKKVALYEYSQHQLIQDQIDELIRDKVLNEERLERLTGSGIKKPPITQGAKSLDQLPASRSKRKALLIGSKSYTHGFAPLDNTLNDVQAMSDLLSGMGYEVISSEDESSDLIQLKINRYIKSLQPGDYSIIYYAGHGFQSDGHNYITSKDANGEEIAKGINRAIKVTPIVEQVASRKPALNVLLLDACQSWIASLNGGTGGLAAQYQGEGGGNYFFSMAAAPGKGSIDGIRGSGKHGLFTFSLLQHLSAPEDIQTVFSKVIKEVKELSGGLQVPDVRNNLEGPFYLAQPGAVYKNKSKIKSNPTQIIPDKNRTSANIPCAELEADGNDSLSTSPLVACINLEIDLATNKIAHLEANIDQITAAKTNWYRSELSDSGLIREKLQQMWHKKLTFALNLLITLLIIVTMISGDLLRYFWAPASLAISDYEYLKNKKLRHYLKSTHLSTDQLIDACLVKFKSYNATRVKKYQWWNVDTDFYDVFPVPDIGAPDGFSNQAAYKKLIHKLGDV